MHTRTTREEASLLTSHTDLQDGHEQALLLPHIHLPLGNPTSPLSFLFGDRGPKGHYIILLLLGNKALYFSCEATANGFMCF